MKNLARPPDFVASVAFPDPTIPDATVNGSLGASGPAGSAAFAAGPGGAEAPNLDPQAMALIANASGFEGEPPAGQSGPASLVFEPIGSGSGLPGQTSSWPTEPQAAEPEIGTAVQPGIRFASSSGSSGRVRVLAARFAPPRRVAERVGPQSRVSETDSVISRSRSRQPASEAFSHESHDSGRLS